MDSNRAPEKPNPAHALRSRSAPIIERAPLPIVEVQGSSHIVTYVNSSFCRLLGRTRAELIGKPFADIVCNGAKCVPILDQVYKTGEAATLAQTDDSDPGSSFWLYAMWPALNANNEPEGVIIQLTKAASFHQSTTEVNEALLIAGLHQHELTEKSEKLNQQLQAEVAERKQVEEALRESREELRQHAGKLEETVSERTAKLKESIKSLEGITYTMAHDLRAPIRAMKAFAVMLAEDVPLNELGKAHVERIQQAAERMDQLVNDLLDYSQLTHQEFPIHTVDLKRQVEKVLVAIAEETQDANARVQVQEPMPAVRANETLLQQILSNLILNAFKFVPTGVPPRVLLRAETCDAFVRLCVEDNGIGIHAQYHDQIFGVFQRLHTTEAFPGTGVGLAITKRAVERMGGRAGVESEPGKGSKFWIELPKA